MDNPGTDITIALRPRRATAEPDHVALWLDNCHRGWIKAWLKPLRVVSLVVWLPALFALYNLLLYYQLMSRGARATQGAYIWTVRMIDLYHWTDYSAIPLGLIAGVIIAGAACAAYRYDPEIRLTTAMQRLHDRLRRRVRRSAYGWLFRCAVLPPVAYMVFKQANLYLYGKNIDPYWYYYGSMYWQSGYSHFEWETLFYTLGICLALLVVSAELTQYFILHFAHKPAWWRVSAVVLSLLGYSAVIWVWNSFNAMRDPPMLQAVLEIFFLFIAVPLGAVLLVLIETRYPSKGILDNL